MGKKRFHRIPPFVAAKQLAIPGDLIKVGFRINTTGARLDGGEFSHLGLTSSTDLPATQLTPSRDQGLMARRNLDGWRGPVRRNLPKVSKSYSIETPNFGDWSKGSHTLTWTRDVYQRDEYLPPGLTFSIRTIDRALGDDDVLFLRVEIEQPISKADEALEVFALSLAQETFRRVDVVAPGADDTEFLRADEVEWELIPKGTRDVVARMSTPIPGSRHPVLFEPDRADFFRQVDPDNYVKGTSGFTRYSGLLFGDVLILENLTAGNALYIIHRGWHELSKLTKSQLLRLSSASVTRIVHNDGWQDRVRREMLRLTGRHIIPIE